MGLCVYLVCGMVVGLLARCLVRAKRRAPATEAAAVGAGGSLMGAMLVGAAGELSLLELDTIGVMGSVIGALLLLVVAHGYRRMNADADERSGPAEWLRAQVQRDDLDLEA
jgi:uncharacterized membrane protein YeaQ/YmgE (transglycosylase-associated protein family)